MKTPLSPIDIELLLWCHCRAEPHPRITVPAIAESLFMFQKCGMISETTNKYGCFTTTDKGRAMVEAMCAIAEPRVQLIPCPFCGAVPKQGEYGWSIFHADTCFLPCQDADFIGNNENAIRAWNTRKQNDAVSGDACRLHGASDVEARAAFIAMPAGNGMVRVIKNKFGSTGMIPESALKFDPPAQQEEAASIS